MTSERKRKNVDSRRQKPEIIEETTQIQTPVKPGCRLDYPINGCLSTILMVILIIIASNELKRSNIRLERDKIKFEQAVKDGTIVNDTLPVVKPDTLKVGNFEQSYIPLLKLYKQRQKN